MDNLLEILIPLIFAAIYFFGNVFSGKDEEDSAPKEAPRRRNEDPAGEAIERQRRIQEEIRRKIMERRRAAQGSPPAEPAETPVPARPEPVARTPEPAPRRPDPRARDRGFWNPEPVSRIPEPVSRIPEPVSRIPEPVSNPYESQMEARLEKIEATKRRAEQLKKQAQARRDDLDAPDISSPGTRGRSRVARRSVRETLVNPAAARAAFVYAEVLGQPVSQRKSPTVPGLS
jgi:hypothetical protein